MSPTQDAIPKEVLDAIVAKARAEWPEVYEMQVFVIGKQSAAYLEFQKLEEEMRDGAATAAMLDFAARSWPGDYEMQLFTFREQRLAMMQFITYSHDKIPPRVMDQIKLKAWTAWPGDYKMRMFEVQTEVAVWLHLNPAVASQQALPQEMLQAAGKSGAVVSSESDS